MVRHGRVYLDRVVTTSPQTRIQICGELAVRIDGEPVAQRLPGRQGRLLFVYFVLNRTRAARRGELIEALWPTDPPPAPEIALRALLSKLRGVLGAAALDGRDPVRLCLPTAAWSTSRPPTRPSTAPSRPSLRASGPGPGPAQVALFTSRREFLAGEEAPWIEEQRRALAELEIRALEAYGGACLQIGGTELPAAERAGRALTLAAPYRESGHQLLIESLARIGNVAEALRAYDSLRQLLQGDLGIAPNPEMRELHARLLRQA